MFTKAARFLSWLAVISLLLSTTLSVGVFVWYGNMMNVAGPHQDDVFVVIAPGSGHNTLRQI